MAHRSDTPYLPQDTSHLLSLLLCSLVCAKLFLGNLECTLVLPNLEQLGDMHTHAHPTLISTYC
jgi:hypothetical protein